MVILLPKDGHPQSPGWSPIIPRMVTHNPKYGHPTSKGWSPTMPSMVTHHPKLIRSVKALRNFNHTWSLTLVQPSLSNLNYKQMLAEYSLQTQQR